MKKFWCLLLLPLIALMALTGCGNDKNIEDLKKCYTDMISVGIIEENNMFFSDDACPNTITIKYSDDVDNAIENTSPSTDIQKKYVAIGYQQKILNNIFNFYEKNQESFYKIMSSETYDKNDINGLYNTLLTLKNALAEFKSAYILFVDATSGGVSNVMDFNLTNYSYELNKVIDKAFDFIYDFQKVFIKYCCANYSLPTVKNLEIRIEKSYVDIAYIVYLENFKALDYSVGSKGICDLSAIVDQTNDYSLVSHLQDCSNLSSQISTNLDVGALNYDATIAIINKYVYSIDIFEQNLKAYKNVYNEQDIYKITQYKFGLVTGVTYESYLQSLSASERATISILNNFVNETFINLVDKLSLVIEK